MDNGKISMWQAIMLFSLSRVFNILNYIPAFGVQVEGTAMLYGTILGTIMQCVIIIPILLINQRHPNDTVITLSFKQSKALGYIVTFFYLAVILFITIGSAAAFDFFLVNAVYPEATVTTITITMLIACAYCANCGFQGLARAGTIIFVTMAIFVLFISIFSIGEISLFNIRPTLNEPIKSMFSYAFSVMAKNAELYAIMLFFPQIKGSKTRCIYLYIAITGALALWSTFLIESVLGAFSHIQVFPFFTLTAVINMPLFNRLDSIHMVSWVVLSFIRITLFLLTANKLINDIVPKKVRKFTAPVVMVVCIAATIFMVQNISFLKSTTMPGTFLWILLLLIIPILILFLSRKEKNASESNKNTPAPATGIGDGV